MDTLLEPEGENYGHYPQYKSPSWFCYKEPGLCLFSQDTMRCQLLGLASWSFSLEIESIPQGDSAS